MPAQVPAFEADKLADRSLHFLLTRQASPTRGKMRYGPPGVSLGKLAIDDEQQFLIGEMRLFR